mmetsp:Transcript_143419/g.202773  ORF Transcript_143419/g.202773 Transcript_143419/m.202773 type:complete len:652 (+) Transcript_143419:173-2128(+)
MSLVGPDVDVLSRPHVSAGPKVEVKDDGVKWPEEVLAFVERATALCRPDKVHLCTGSVEENQTLLNLLEEGGTIQKLNDKLRPGCYAARSDPADVARSMGDTYICSEREADSGPSNQWAAPADMKARLKQNFNGCMEGRTMYVVPFCMGPVLSPAAKFCVQVTDSPYVVVSLRITTRMGAMALENINGDNFIQCWHSVGCPLTGDADEVSTARSSWPCNIPERKIVQFPDTREVWSFGSGYGGNALLGKKCVALRIASAQGRDEGWLAEHMLILGITNPQGEKRYICAAFPSACGKTNLAMLTPSLPGWKVETIGDDIAWLRFDKDGRMRAINPENGFFGVAPGTSNFTNPNAMATFATNSLFTNVGVTDDGDVYWEGMDDRPDCGITDWKGNKDWQPTLKPNGKVDTKKDPAAHPNSRFTAPLSQCPILDPLWDSPEGVPIDAIIFGGRRDDTQPLVYESFGWDHGTFLGATMRSNATKAADQRGLVHDPMAMIPFIGYNIKDYFGNWLRMREIAEQTASPDASVVMPRIFHVNWFGKGDDGEFLWPGFSENCRVLEWILERCAGRTEATETPIGLVPSPGTLNLEGLKDFNESDLEKLLTVDPEKWEAEAAEIRRYFTETLMKGDNTPMPEALMAQLGQLEARIASLKQ